MNAPLNLAAADQWDPEVLAFAAEKGVQDRLQPLLDATRRLFPRAKSIRVCAESDPDFPDRYIVLDVEVVDLGSAEADAARWAWNEECFRLEPPALTGIFRLRLDWVDP